MEFRIADTFTASLARLTGAEQKAVKTTAFDLQLNASAPGLHLHRLDRARDPNFWSVRVNDDIRLIVHRTATNLLLSHVGHHGAAYTWPERRNIERHPVTGAAQLVELPERVESLSPHRVMAVDEDDSLIDTLDHADPGAGWNDFAQMVLDNLKNSGVQQAHKEDRIAFTALTPWPGKLVCAEGRYLESDRERRAAISLGPEFGTVQRADLVDTAREAADARFDVVIACAFNFDAHSAELDQIGRIPILKARMNPDLHMAGELKNTGSGNLFVVFGEPDIAIEPVGGDQIRVRIKGVDVFKPQTGEIESGGPDTIALWFIDTDYNEESFFVRHAYFLGAATDPYKALKTTLRAEIDEEAWASLKNDTSRPFPKPKSGRIAIKVINHLGDEVMKVFPVR